MGLLKEHKNLKFYQKICRPYLISLFMKTVDQFIFLGKPEYEYAIKKYPKLREKFTFLPFAVDYNFWAHGNNHYKYRESKQILFVGNDGNRNYEFISALPSYLEEFNFVLITDQIKNNINLKNVNLISGNWTKGNLNDLEVKKYYEDSFLTLVPIKNTLQPSGQSVSLQSMSTGTPVLISDYEGFWDKENFVKDRNIFFIDGFVFEEWAQVIRQIHNDQKQLEYISNSGRRLIKESYDIDKFVSKLVKIINKVI